MCSTLTLRATKGDRSGDPNEQLRPPSRLLTSIAGVGVPLAIICVLLAVSCVVSLVINIVQGNGLYSIFISIAGAAFFAEAATWTLELRRTVRDWKAAMLERQRLLRDMSKDPGRADKR